MTRVASIFARLGTSLQTALGLPRGRDAATAARVPNGNLVYAVGDIHGRLDLLDTLTTLIVQDAQRRAGAEDAVVAVFVGDYVDRGPHSRGVVERLMSGLPLNWDCRFLKGNHEEALLDFLRDPRIGEAWCEFGGLDTLASYGVVPKRSGAEIDWDSTSAAFADALPTAHRDFLERLGLYETIGDYVFVHAGVRPRIPLDYQSERDLLWIREEFTAAGRALPQTVVYGHTPSEKVVVGPGRIGIDTGAYATGKLTAAGFQGAEVWYLST